MDLSFFENRININMMYYNCRMEDKYVIIFLLFLLGVFGIILNNGKLQN